MFYVFYFFKSDNVLINKIIFAYLVLILLILLQLYFEYFVNLIKLELVIIA